MIISISTKSEDNPFVFIDTNAQKMADVLVENVELFEKDRSLYEDKIKEIFEPMIDFRRVAASVMGKKYYLMASETQRAEFVLIFKESLLDNYASTLAQWGDSTITTVFPEEMKSDFDKNIEVKQILDTGTSQYPVSYKVRKTKDGWKIVNIIINGVNLGLTLRNQFQALAISYDEDIEIAIKNWVSDFGDAGIS
jgi:phospholipid transport system substrate-binding protein|tara:strand:- start:4588 stop:5172 length:585 start_codon:yes stop_codon:yes gene_type:complete